jgi:hypothetical protein
MGAIAEPVLVAVSPTTAWAAAANKLSVLPESPEGGCAPTSPPSRLGSLLISVLPAAVSLSLLSAEVRPASVAEMLRTAPKRGRALDEEEGGLGSSSVRGAAALVSTFSPPSHCSSALAAPPASAVANVGGAASGACSGAVSGACSAASSAVCSAACSGTCGSAGSGARNGSTPPPPPVSVWAGFSPSSPSSPSRSSVHGKKSGVPASSAVSASASSSSSSSQQSGAKAKSAAHGGATVRGSLSGVRLFQPWDVSWWVAWLFLLGSMAWMTSGALSVWPSSDTSLPGVELRNFYSALAALVGSLLFELGSVFAIWEAINPYTSHEFGFQVAVLRGRAVRCETKWRWWTWDMHEPFKRAAVAQLVGASLFLLASVASMPLAPGQPSLLGTSGASQWFVQELLVLTPQTVACGCFLYSALVCLLELAPPLPGACMHPRSIGWQANFCYLLGSLSFLYSSAWGELANYFGRQNMLGEYWANAVSVFSGAAFFFAGSLLLVAQVARRRTDYRTDYVPAPFD